MSKRAQFLAGDRVEDVAIFLHEEGVGTLDALSEYAETVDDGVVLVLDGAQGRSAFQSATGLDPMSLARRAMDTNGEIDRSLAGGTCPNEASGSGEGDNLDEGDEVHTVKFLFAFAEAQNDEVGGLYAEGDVIHGYAVCTCGASYSEKWVAGE